MANQHAKNRAVMKTTPNKLTEELRGYLLIIEEDRNKLIAQLASINNRALAEKLEVDISTIQKFFNGRTYRKIRLEK